MNNGFTSKPLIEGMMVTHLRKSKFDSFFSPDGNESQTATACGEIFSESQLVSFDLLNHNDLVPWLKYVLKSVTCKRCKRSTQYLTLQRHLDLNVPPRPISK